jgi:cytochrome d ubiquinol oxidase subunit II
VLATIALLFVLAGLVLYTVLAGADFGAGLWQLLAGPGARGRAIRDQAHHAMAPVWEANHVWLIFALTVGWTAFPSVVAAIASTLTIPLSLAAVGIILRGLTYALQSATDGPRERRILDTVFAISSILTPFMLGAVVGAIASDRVPVGNAAGNLVTSWVNPTAILSGCLAVAVGGFLAAVYLAADARRLGTAELATAFRARGLISGVLAGALALAGLIVAHSDARRIYDGLVHGWGLAAVIVSGLAGVVTLALVWRNQFQLARASAAVAVAAIVGGWAAAQRPMVLPGLSLRQAAASNATMVALIVAVVVGGLILAPSLALLFRLLLTGRLDADHTDVEPPGGVRTASHRPGHTALTARSAVALVVIGLILLTIAEPPAAHAAGVAVLLSAALLAFTAVAPVDLGDDDERSRA